MTTTPSGISAQTPTRATAQVLVSMEALVQQRLVQIADLANQALKSQAATEATLRQILSASLESMNEVSGLFETAGV